MPAGAATAPGLPSRLGKYELLLPLAAGGMARIYIARTTGIGSFERHVVLKLITPERANDQTAVQMFLDEARLAASLNHQNVAQVFEVGEDAGIHYLAMEYVHGQDLRALLAKAGSQGTRIPQELALTVVAGAAAGLNHAHERRGPDGQPLCIVHRDVSPSNIMIGYDGAVKLLDFGIAKATSRSVETQSGIIKGKFAYMAPEQCRGREVDRRSDVFSLGIILYEISTQHRCFRADSDFDTMHRIVTGDVVRPSRLVAGYPQALEAIVMKALAVDANQRYQSAGLLLEAIEAFAVSARMSLSTMGLGRFMRDMFGEVTEPWLTSAPKLSAPVITKENTISSTNGRPGSAPIDTGGAVPVVAGFEDAQALVAGKTVLDLPRGHERHDTEEPGGPEWNARSYPASLPAVASSATLGNEAVRPSYPPAGQIHGQPAVLGQAPAGTQPLPAGGQLVPPFQPAPGSASGPAIPAPGNLPSTRHGYAGGAGATHNDLSYPRYEPELSPDALEVRPNRRPLIIGGLLGAVGLAVILAVTLGTTGGNGNEVAAPQGASDQPGSDNASSEVAAPPAGAASDQAPAPGSAENADDFVKVQVISHPPGADVLIAGTKIGVTPLDTKLKRGSKVAQLTVHLDGYVDVNSKIDFGGDYQKEVTLKRPGEDDGSAAVPAGGAAGPGSDVAAGSAAHATAGEHRIVTPPPHAGDHRVEHHPVTTPHPTAHPVTHEGHEGHTIHDPEPPPPHEDKPKCQPPGSANPFDTSCNGGPCPICK